MTTLIFLAVLIAITTTITALLTGRLLSEKKRKLFQLEMEHEELKRQLHEVELRKKSVRGSVELLARVKGEKEHELILLADELAELKTEALPQIRVNKALQRKSFHVAEVAA